MTVTLRKDGRWEASVYDSDTRRKRYVGRYSSRAEALSAVATWKTDLANRRRCPGCRKLFFPLDEYQKRCSERCESMVKRREQRKRERRDDDHWVYACFDAQGEVIYVGYTSTGLRRQREHGRERTWWPKVATIRVQHFATREEGLAAEAETIQRLRPPFNTLYVLVEAEDAAA